MTSKGFLRQLFGGSSPEESGEKEGADKSNKAPIEEKENTDVVSQEVITFGQQKLQSILDLAGLSGRVIIPEDKRPGGFSLHISEMTQDKGTIIGREGSMIEALQILIKGALYRKYGQAFRFNLDAANYRKKRIEGIKARAWQLSKAINSDMPRLELDPMGSFERRIIHMLFKENDELKSYSIGDGPKRHVVLEKR